MGFVEAGEVVAVVFEGVRVVGSVARVCWVV